MDTASATQPLGLVDETLVAEAPTHVLPSDSRRVLDRQPQPDHPVGGPWKRAFDFLVGIVLAILLLPFAIPIAILVYMNDGSAPLFGHERYGYGGRRFFCYKFRSMVVDSAEVLHMHLASNPEAAAEWAQSHKLRNDPRVTPIGKFLRVTSLDELPQIVNVLRGDMSLVGPRPVVAEEIAKYGDSFAEYSRCRPGITGLWQVGGRSDVDYAKRVELDVMYVRTWSPIADLAILVRTVFVVLLCKGSC